MAFLTAKGVQECGVCGKFPVPIFQDGNVENIAVFAFAFAFCILHFAFCIIRILSFDNNHDTHNNNNTAQFTSTPQLGTLDFSSNSRLYLLVPSSFIGRILAWVVGRTVSLLIAFRVRRTSPKQ